MRERVLVIRAGGDGAAGSIRALEGRYPDLEFVYCESFLSGIVEASRGSVRAMLARVDGGPRRLSEAVGALREAGGRETKIVLCCSPEHEPQAREAMTGGADDYVIEPVLAADVDRAIGYGRVEDLPLASLARTRKAEGWRGETKGWFLEPTASMEELARIAEILSLMDAAPDEMLQKAADLIREAMSARGAMIVVEGAVVRSGDPEARAVLTAVLRSGERIIGQVSVGERNVEKSKSRKVEMGSDEATMRRCDEGEPQDTGGQAASGTHDDSGARDDSGPHGAQPSPRPLSRGARGVAYTLGDAQKLEHHAGVLSQVLAAAGRQRELKRLAVTDEASGLPNRRYLREQLGEILQRAAAERFPVTVLLFDVDDFKTYNDRYGHGAGDEILRVTGELFRKNCREQDVVARYGGDEFAVVFYDPHGPREPGSKPPAEALFVLDRFKDALATVHVRSDEGRKVEKSKSRKVDILPEDESDEGRGDGATGRRSDEGPRITISGGLATYPWDAGTMDSLLAAADRALMAAKRAGKNRIFVVGE